MEKRTIASGTNAVFVESVGAGDSGFDYTVGAGCHLSIVLPVRTAGSVRVTVRLAEPGSSVDIIGVSFLSGSDAVEMHTLQHHAAPQTTSNLMVKTVLSDTARFLYEGAIRVDRPAQRTDAYQRNENLLLSRTAHAESKPMLEILANDVRCTHGATVGTLSDEQLWYMATRGIPTAEATRLIVRGFLLSALGRVPDDRQKQVVGMIEGWI